MLVAVSTKITSEQRDAFFAVADNMNITSSALLRSIIVRYIDGGDAVVGNLAGTIQSNHEDLTRVLVLTRFLAEGVDKETTDVLLERTDAYLASLTNGNSVQPDGRI